MGREITIHHNGSFDIATGKNRKETHWRNREVQWSEFLRKICETHRTAEKYSEYMSAKKSRQDEIKDVGGFVGGYVNNGRRKSENILHRQLITLDIDFGTNNDVWGDFTLLYGNAAAVYSTHKHNPVTPRLRLIVPLDRPVGSDEYIAIARRIADNLDINIFDDTTFEPSRLMYWPSTAKDGEYVFEYQDGEWLCADEVLATYRNWQDASEWPVSDRVGDVIRREIKKQGDPLEKPGVVGAFCRTYSIDEAIETFLDDAYEACDIENRYTYKEGSTAAGLVIYDEKYAYSHHGTDPASGKLCNAFDLVRLHLFGLRDEDVKEGTPGNRLPSYTSMVDFATKDSQVRKRIGIEKLKEVQDDFAGILDDENNENTPDVDWLEKMDVDGKGNYYSTTNNIRLILENDPLLKKRFAKNNFEKRELALDSLPWRTVNRITKYLTDVDDAGLRDYLETTYDITGMQKVKDGLDLTVEKFSFHPVKDYLNSVKWDEEKRVDRLLVDYLGAEDSAYVHAVTRKTLVAAVSRIFEPGIKFDYVLTLIGGQGVGKSTIVRKLGKEWYSDSFGTVQGKEAFEQIQGVWILEMAELAGLKKAEMETIKHFISKQEDRYRVAYGRRIENFPRQCIFIGTTNNKDFLKDPTGNRRFWPVDTMEKEPLKSVWDDLDSYEIDQIWAEAVCLYKAGETRYLDKELEEVAYNKQREHSEIDERAGIIQKYLDTLLPTNWGEMDLYQRRNFLHGDELAAEGTKQRDKVCVAEIWCECLEKPKADMDRYKTLEINKIMRGFEDWKEHNGGKGTAKFKLYGTQKCFVRID